MPFKKKSTRSVTKPPKGALKHPVIEDDYVTTHIDVHAAAKAAAKEAYVSTIVGAPPLIPYSAPVNYEAHPVMAKLAKALARMPLSEYEQLVLARLALRTIAEGPRNELREVAQAALRVVG